MSAIRLSILVAMAKNRVIGKHNALPWHLPPDLKHFKALTMGHHIIMGRKTYESIGKPLPGRTNIIVTRQIGYQAHGSIVVHSVGDALQVCHDCSAISSEGFIIGGAELYGQTLDLCQRLYITEIQEDFEGDTFFPELNLDDWNETAREKHHLAGQSNLEYHFIVLNRKT
tara:strand:- start:917 stop:1426 length:510 start_codon:yes stop_codon:yes gene_type:complete